MTRLLRSFGDQTAGGGVLTAGLAWGRRKLFFFCSCQSRIFMTIHSRNGGERAENNRIRLLKGENLDRWYRRTASQIEADRPSPLASSSHPALIS